MLFKKSQKWNPLYPVQRLICNPKPIPTANLWGAKKTLIYFPRGRESYGKVVFSSLGCFRKAEGSAAVASCGGGFSTSKRGVVRSSLLSVNGLFLCPGKSPFPLLLQKGWIVNTYPKYWIPDVSGNCFAPTELIGENTSAPASP